MNPKYIVIIIGTIEQMVIFSPHIDHISFWKLCGERPLLSAGFIDLQNKKAYGESISLLVSSRKEDNLLLNSLYQK